MRSRTTPSFTQRTTASASVPRRERLLPAVAGMPIHHEIEGDIAFAEAPAWAGSRVTEEPVRVRHRVGNVAVTGLRVMFEASPSCTYYAEDGGTVVAFRGPVPGVPDQLLRSIRPGYEYELVYAHEPSEPMYQRAKDRTIFSMALAQRGRGYIAHACGFLRHGAGVLCPGLPSAGKSTLARLLGEPGIDVVRLSDDRIALTRDGEAVRMWGTPWPGDAGVIGAGDGAVRTIVTLRHGAVPALAPLTGMTAVRRLLETLVLPLWDRARLPAGIEFVRDLVARVPVVEFSYPPTADAVRWLVHAIDEAAHARG